MKRDYDVIIAGGGLAGTIAAQSVHKYSGGNLSILVIDRSPEHMPGSKSVAGWICGDAVSKEAVDYMTERIGTKWESPEIEHKVKGVMAFSPDRETSIPFDGDGYMLNRKLLPERQNQRCKNMGIEFVYKTNLGGLLYENGQVIGVRGVGSDGSAFKKTASIVIDATGVTSMLRNQIENTTKIEKKIDRHDVESTGRHIMDFETGEQIIAALDENGFEEAFPIQQAAIPVLLTGRDVIGQAHTGTGKTAAYSISMLEKSTRIWNSRTCNCSY